MTALVSVASLGYLHFTQYSRTLRGIPPGDFGMNASIARGSSWEEDEGEGHIAVMVPYALYREIQCRLDAIGSQAKPDDLIADVIRGYLNRCGRVTPSTTTQAAR